jgi:hypothetical protein
MCTWNRLLDPLVGLPLDYNAFFRAKGLERRSDCVCTIKFARVRKVHVNGVDAVCLELSTDRSAPVLAQMQRFQQG